MPNVSLIEECISLASKIAETVKDVKINRNQCNRFATRVDILIYNLKESKPNEKIPNYLPPLMEFQSCLIEFLALIRELSASSWTVRAFSRNVDLETFSELNSRLSSSSQQLNLQYSQTIFSNEDDISDIEQDIILMEKEMDQIVKEDRADNDSETSFEPMKKEYLMGKLANRRNHLINLEKPQIHMEVPKIKLAELNLKELIGEGGFGQVYLAEWGGQEVAVKKLSMKTLTKTQLQDFYRECKIMCNLRNSNTVLLQGIVEEKDTYMLVMEYMEGGSLRDLLHSSKEITWASRGLFAYDIACGMAYLHKSGIVHCDLKSLNILLDMRDTCKICDFGLSKVKLNTDSGINTDKNDGCCGTLRWKAPELFKPNAKFTKETDVFAFAIVLWEISEREVPYGEGFSNTQVIDYVVERGKRLELSPSCPKEIEVLIQECWKTDPKARPLFSTISNTLSTYKPSKIGLQNREMARERAQSIISLKPNHIKKLSQRIQLEEPPIEEFTQSDISVSREISTPSNLNIIPHIDQAKATAADLRLKNPKAKEFWIGYFGCNAVQAPWDDFFDCFITAFNNSKPCNEEEIKQLLEVKDDIVKINSFNRATQTLENFDILFAPSKAQSKEEELLSKDTLNNSENRLLVLPEPRPLETHSVLKKSGSHVSLESVKSNFTNNFLKFIPNPLKKTEDSGKPNLQSNATLNDAKAPEKGVTAHALEKVNTITHNVLNKANNVAQKADSLVTSAFHHGVHAVTNPKDTVLKVGTGLFTKIKNFGGSDQPKDTHNLDSAISTEAPSPEKLQKSWQRKFEEKAENIREELDSAIGRFSNSSGNVYDEVPNFEAYEKQKPQRRPSIKISSRRTSISEARIEEMEELSSPQKASHVQPLKSHEQSENAENNSKAAPKRRNSLFEIKTKVDILDKYVSNQLKETKKTLQKVLTNVPDAPASKQMNHGSQYAEFLIGKKYFEDHDYKKSSEVFINGIRNGSPECYLYLGMMFEDGLGVKNSPELAIQLYQRAIELGNTEGLYKASMMYMMGKGVKKDLKESARLMKLCSKTGYPPSITMLGNMYLDGNGVHRDCQKALELFKLTKGTTVGEYNMGVAYLKMRDYTNALDCFTNTAYEGFAPSQFQLARMYELGRGVKSDLREAMNWYEIAAAQGDQEATMNYNNLSRIERKGKKLARI
ncbi:hypothetical protein HDV04_005863 [Boothiomyces sp. JEL0838]|nr:hypothetical protein HDV04_005863 [Boothiomyces sp. JEL0838]